MVFMNTANMDTKSGLHGI